MPRLPFGLNHLIQPLIFCILSCAMQSAMAATMQDTCSDSSPTWQKRNVPLAQSCTDRLQTVSSFTEFRMPALKAGKPPTIDWSKAEFLRAPTDPTLSAFTHSTPSNEFRSVNKYSAILARSERLITNTPVHKVPAPSSLSLTMLLFVFAAAVCRGNLAFERWSSPYTRHAQIY